MTNKFEELSKEALAKINSFGIKSETVIENFKRSCRMLGAYLTENNLTFSFENGQKWLSEVSPCEPMTNWQYAAYTARRRAVFMLDECQRGELNSWRTYSSKTTAKPKTADYLQLLHSHEDRLRSAGMSASTISFAMRVDSDFMIYLESSGKLEINNITPHDVVGYFTQDSFSGRKPDGIKAYAYKLKAFLEFLEETGIVTEKKLSLAVPKVFAKQESIVTVISEKAEDALRNFKAETKTAVRDHAMILLALRVGIRRSDIVNLKLSDIDWQNDNISFIQQKTGVRITLPLLPDVGNVLMNYILNFRPKTSDDTIFLRHYAPYQKLSPHRKITEKFLSDLEHDDCPQRGLHILRRTFATRMLKNNIPRSIISASIGQTDPNSVDVYLSNDEEKMQKCAISLTGIECGRRDLQ
jgi:integrase